MNPKNELLHGPRNQSNQPKIKLKSKKLKAREKELFGTDSENESECHVSESLTSEFKKKSEKECEKESEKKNEKKSEIDLDILVINAECDLLASPEKSAEKSQNQSKKIVEIEKQLFDSPSCDIDLVRTVQRDAQTHTISVTFQQNSPALTLTPIKENELPITPGKIIFASPQTIENRIRHLPFSLEK